MYYIYKHTLPNGKVYIGQTQQNPKKRWCSGYGYWLQEEFFNDILAVGWNNIKHEILEEVESKEEAALRERYYILENKSNEPEFGYNKHTNLYSTYNDKLAYNRVIQKTYRKNPHKQIKCIETGEIFDTMTAASKSVNRSIEAIRKSIATGNKCAGYHWEKVEP